MNLENWRELNRQRVKNLYHTMRALYDSINLSSSFLISATRMGGLHGYGDPVVTAPMGGSITGFLKAFQREKGAALVKAIDFELDMEPPRIAQAIVSETTRDPDPLEVGYHGENRYGVTLAESTLSRNVPGLTLDERTVYLVTGAANRLTNEIVVDLASNGGTFYMLDLVAVPDAADPRVALFRTDKKALREQLIEEIKTAVPEPTPSMVERIMTAIGREVEVLEAIESVGAAGGVAHYYCLDLLDEAAVSTVVDEIRQEHGRIDVILHTTGLEISRALPEKDPVQFNLVYDLNVDGFFNLLKATENMSVEALGVFSVMETRFGTWGQADSTAADDLLRKVIISLDRKRPETRGIFLSWITGSEGDRLGKLIDELSLPTGSGFAIVRDELTSGTAGGEIYFELGSHTEAGHSEVDDTL
jgi:NAD(P)-dependent dehydrogenase (short-subunit alcohol dehydrogenase family)